MTVDGVGVLAEEDRGMGGDLVAAAFPAPHGVADLRFELVDRQFLGSHVSSASVPIADYMQGRIGIKRYFPKYGSHDR